MSQPGDDYSLGLAFGRVVQAQPLRHPARLNAVLADLLAGDLSLRAPLRELVELPAFLEAEPLVASATAVALVSFLLDELRSIYRDETLARLREVLLGYFAIPEAKAEPADAPFAQQGADRRNEIHNEQREEVDQPNNCQQVDNRLVSVERRKEILKNHLNLQLWHEADQETWRLLVESSGGSNQDSFEMIFRAAPCDLLYEINRLWCEASHYRFGFSVQRGLWEELGAICSSANRSFSAGSPSEPARIFVEFLKSRTSQSLGGVHSGVMDSAGLPPGFYPRGGMHRVWGGHRGWQIAWDSTCLLSHFAEVHARLVDCGLVGVKLDAGTRQQLQALHQAASPASATPPKANTASVRKSTEAKQPAAQPAKPPVSKPNQNSLNYGNGFSGFFFIAVLSSLLAIFVGSHAGPTVNKACSDLPFYVTGFCYLWHVPTGLAK